MANSGKKSFDDTTHNHTYLGTGHDLENDTWFGLCQCIIIVVIIIITITILLLYA